MAVCLFRVKDIGKDGCFRFFLYSGRLLQNWGFQKSTNGADVLDPQNGIPCRLREGQIGQFHLIHNGIHTVHPVSAAILLKFRLAGDQVGLRILCVRQHALFLYRGRNGLHLFLVGQTIYHSLLLGGLFCIPRLHFNLQIGNGLLRRIRSRDCRIRKITVIPHIFLSSPIVNPSPIIRKSVRFQSIYALLRRFLGFCQCLIIL